MTKKNNTLTYRVGQLEKKVDNAGNKLDIIRANDVPHLANEIATMKGEVKNLKGRIDYLTIFNVGAIILGLLINRFF